jgi:hypothetical protein
VIFVGMYSGCIPVFIFGLRLAAHIAGARGARLLILRQLVRMSRDPSGVNQCSGFGVVCGTARGRGFKRGETLVD